MTVAEGSAIATENIYEGRFQFVDELVRMGADVRTEGRHAIVRGVERLSGAPVTASDVRAGAALVLAGLVADGETVVHGCEHVDRGYPDLAGDPPVPRRRRRADLATAQNRQAGNTCDTGGVLRTVRRPGVRCPCRSISPPPKTPSSRRSTRSVPRSRATAATSSTRASTPTAWCTSARRRVRQCPVSMMTLKAGVERIIMDRVPGVTEVVADE